MTLFQFLPRFVRLAILHTIEQELSSLSDAEIAKGIEAVKAFVLARIAALLHL